MIDMTYIIVPTSKRLDEVSLSLLRVPRDTFQGSNFLSPFAQTSLSTTLEASYSSYIMAQSN